MRVILFVISMLSVLSVSVVALAQTETTTVTNPTTATVPATTPAVSNATAAALTPNNANTQQIETTVHQYLLKKPEVVVEALQNYQQKQMESMQDLFKETQKVAPQNVDALFHNPADPVVGDAKGKITVVEFTDYQCSHCIEVSPIVDQIMKANPKLRVVIKEFPIRGAVSEAAARAGLAANKQGKYWAFHVALYKVSSALTEDKIYEVAQSVGLNVDQLKKDMDDKAIRDAVAATQKLATTLKLIGTPAFFIAKTDIKAGAPSSAINYIPGILTQQQLQAILDKLAH